MRRLDHYAIQLQYTVQEPILSLLPINNLYSTFYGLIDDNAYTNMMLCWDRSVNPINNLFVIPYVASLRCLYIRGKKR